jgi:alpha-mannosidase
MIVTRITSHVTLTAGVPRVDIHTEVDNRARDHRLRVHFPTPFAVTEADYDGHFEIVRRPIGVPEFDESWVERPRPEVPQRAFTSVSDGQQRLTVANRGLPEVEVLRLPKSSRSTPETQCRGLRLRKSETTEIALTLLRCINWISRDDFEARRGHAGPMASTPGAQMIGLWTFDYSIIPHAVGRDSIPPSSSRQDRILPYHQAYAFETPLRAVSTGLHDGPLPACGSFVESSPQEFVISAVKETEDGNSWLVRGYNISSEEISVTLKPWRKFRRFERVNLAEEKLSALRPAADGRVEFTARAHEIVTIMLNN